MPRLIVLNTFFINKTLLTFKVVKNSFPARDGLLHICDGRHTRLHDEDNVC